MICATAIADQHGYLPTIEPCDLLLIAGDICPDDFVRPDSPDHLHWLDSTFRDWLRGVPAQRIVGIAGNHGTSTRP